MVWWWAQPKTTLPNWLYQSSNFLSWWHRMVHASLIEKPSNMVNNNLLCLLWFLFVQCLRVGLRSLWFVSLYNYFRFLAKHGTHWLWMLLSLRLWWSWHHKRGDGSLCNFPLCLLNPCRQTKHWWCFNLRLSFLFLFISIFSIFTFFRYIHMHHTPCRG